MKLLRSPLIWLAAVLAASLVGLLVLTRSSEAPAFAAHDRAGAVAAVHAPHPAADQDVPEDRELATLKSPGDVSAYLANKLAAARSRGRVEPSDFMNGRRAIERLRGQLSEPEVQARIRRLGEELASLDRALRYKPVTDALDELATQLRGASDAPSRRALAMRYRQAVQDLPAPARQPALARLDTMLQSSTGKL